MESSTFMSPKRKRDNLDLSASPSVTRLKTTHLPGHSSIDRNLTGDGSPRAVVARHLQNLDLSDQFKIDQFDFRPTLESQLNISNPHPGQVNNFVFQGSGSAMTPTSFPVDIGATARPAPPETYHEQPLEIPETPRLRPVSTPPCSPPRPKSPTDPLPTLWWTDTEITGHNPTDPSDDGYGINGVGFIPTPAVANARAERRRRQVTEWKNREAKEARQKRNDRRRRRELEVSNSSGVGEGINIGKAELRKVRFLEV